MGFKLKHFHLICLYLSIQFGWNLADDEKRFDIRFDKVVKFNGTDEYFKYTVDKVVKDESDNIFTIDGTIDLLQNYDNNWKLSIAIYKLDENEEYQLFAMMPKFRVCDFMKVIYKKYFYEDMSKHSNLPAPDECPIPSGHYEIKQYAFDCKMFKAYNTTLEPGSYRFQNFLVKYDVAVTGVLGYFTVFAKSIRNCTVSSAPLQNYETK